MAINTKMEVSLGEDDLKEILIDFLKSKGTTFSKEDIKFDSTSKIIHAWEWNKDVIVKVSASKDIWFKIGVRRMKLNNNKMLEFNSKLEVCIRINPKLFNTIHEKINTPSRNSIMFSVSAMINSKVRRLYE